MNESIRCNHEGRTTEWSRWCTAPRAWLLELRDAALLHLSLVCWNLAHMTDMMTDVHAELTATDAGSMELSTFLSIPCASAIFFCGASSLFLCGYFHVSLSDMCDDRDRRRIRTTD